MGETQQVELSCKDKVTTGEILVSIPTGSERVGKAIGLGLLMLLLTALSAFLPLIHFVLVPTLFIVTIVVILSALKRRKFIDSGSGTCPACDASFHIRRRRFSLPFADVCGQCGRQVIIRNTDEN